MGSHVNKVRKGTGKERKKVVDPAVLDHASGTQPSTLHARQARLQAWRQAGQHLARTQEEHPGVGHQSDANVDSLGLPGWGVARGPAQESRVWRKRHRAWVVFANPCPAAAAASRQARGGSKQHC
jgi:hypothetical protein